jgi:hypothetical protein
MHRIAMASFVIRLGTGAELSDPSFRCLADSRVGVGPQPLDFREGTANAMTDGDSGRHLPDPPSFVAKSGEDRRPSLVIPRPQESACRPDSQPIGGTWRLIEASGPASGPTAQRKDQ